MFKDKTSYLLLVMRERRMKEIVYLSRYQVFAISAERQTGERLLGFVDKEVLLSFHVIIQHNHTAVEG